MLDAMFLRASVGEYLQWFFYLGCLPYESWISECYLHFLLCTLKKEIKKKKLEVVSKLKPRLTDKKDETEHYNRLGSTKRKNNDNFPAATKIRNEEEKSWVCHCEVLHPGAQVSDQDNREAHKVHELRRREVPDQDAVR